MNLRRLIENILLESEIDNIIKNKKEKMGKSEIGKEPKFSNDFDFYTNQFIKNIPTPKKYISKFFDLVEELYLEHEFDLTECFEEIYYYFNKWMLYKSKNLINKDILAQTPKSLIDIIDEVESNIKRKELEGNVDKVYEDNKWLVLRIDSKEASCKYGSDTKWCISATKGDNRYSGYGYSENNFIYFVIDKKEKLDPDDVLYKMAILVNKKTKLTEVWDAKDKRLTPEQVNIVKRFIPEIFDSITKNVFLAKDELDVDFIKSSLYDNYKLKYIKDYKRTDLNHNTDFSKLELKYKLPRSHHFIECDVDIRNNNISSTFYYYELINSEKTGENYYKFTPTSIISKVSNKKITKSNFISLIKKSVADLLKTPEVKQFYKDYPNEYFSSIKLYRDIDTMGTKKVPQAAFITAIKLLKDKGEQNITTIRRIVDPRLLASHNVKPLLRSLYSFGLIKLEKRGGNVMIVPTPKLVKTPLDKLI